MNDKRKYVIVQDRGVELAIVFHEILSHIDVARSYGASNVVSAGFCDRGVDGLWAAWGESVTLRIKSRGSIDADILNRQIG